MQRKSIDTPLAEITLRRYEKPYHLGKRELVRKLCLSLGLLNPGDSRDVIVDVLFVLLEAMKNREMLSSEDITNRVIELRKSEKLSLLGTAASNIRRQIRRLRELMLVEKIKNRYRITEFMRLSQIYEEKIRKFLLENIESRVRDYVSEVDKLFSLNSEGEEKNGELQEH